MSSAVRWCVVLIVLTVALAVVSGQKTKQTSSNSLQLADDAIAKDRSTRTLKKVQRKLGFFGTLKELFFDQINDTRSAYDQLSTLINDNFASEDTKSSPQLSLSASSEDDNIESTTTEAPPAKLTRDEFMNILRLNFLGLRRLFDEEWKLAMADSKKNIQEYKQQFKNEMYKEVSNERKR